MIKRHIAAQLPIAVFTDYDVDGLGAALIMIQLLQALGAQYYVYAPRRSVDGYGITNNFVSKLSGYRGLLITVDNGIAAIEQVNRAKALGWEVLIMDHHHALENDGIPEIPRADFIIDPEVFGTGCDFTHYCGAGLAFKLAQFMLDDQYLIDKLNTFAAISTVADVVPLIEDNRQIVKRGLELMNRGVGTVGLQKLLEYLQIRGFATAKDLGFSIGPMMNAATRMEAMYEGWNGSDFVINALLCEDEMLASQYSMQLSEINKQRKEITAAALETVKCDILDSVNFIKVDAPAGLCGIIAPRVMEQNPKPTFVFMEENGVCTGSARSDDETQNNVKEMLETCRDLLIKYGGHPGAAGFSFKIENMDEIHKRLSEYPVVSNALKQVYDLELNKEDIVSTLCELDRIEPFGKGLEAPIFRVACRFNDRDQNGNITEYWHGMGKDGSHLRLDLTPQLKAVAFNMKPQFDEE